MGDGLLTKDNVHLPSIYSLTRGDSTGDYFVEKVRTKAQKIFH